MDYNGRRRKNGEGVGVGGVSEEMEGGERT